MYILKPSFYDKIHCIGKECRLTCCGGWNITVDEKAYEKYKEYDGEWGENIRNNIFYNEERQSYEMKLNRNIMCPFLNKEQLCSMVIEKGEEALCHTCTTYPRENILTTEIEEKYLSLGCPNVIALLNETQEPLSFLLEEDDRKSIVDDLPENEKAEILKLYETITEDMNIRNCMLDFLQDRSFPLWFRGFFVVYCLDKMKKEHRNGNFERINVELERLLQPSFVEQLYNSVSAAPRDMEKQFLQFSYIGKLFTKPILSCAYNDKYKSRETIIELLNQNMQCGYEEYKAAYDKWSGQEKEKFDILMENIMAYNWMQFALKGFTEDYMLDNFLGIILENILIKHFSILYYSMHGEIGDSMQEFIVALCVRKISNAKNRVKEELEKLKEEGILSVANLYFLLRD